MNAITFFGVFRNRNYVANAPPDRQLPPLTLLFSGGFIMYEDIFESIRNEAEKRNLRERTPPTVLTHQEINSIIDIIRNLKYKAIIATMYPSGLRVPEVIHLRYDDISRTNMTVHVRETKGRSDRFTILSQKNLDSHRILVPVSPADCRVAQMYYVMQSMTCDSQQVR